MAYGDCWVVNDLWHPGHKRDIVDIGGRPHAICRDCLAICTISDTYDDKYEAREGRGQGAVKEKGGA